MDPDAPLFTRLFAASRAQAHCISRAQLGAIGITGGTVASLEARGALHHAARSAFLVGSPELSPRRLLWTGLLTAGPDANASHWSSATLYRFAHVDPGEAWVSTPGRRSERTVQTLLPAAETGRAATVRIIGSRRTAERHVVDGVPTDSPARTMVAIAGRGTAEAVTSAWIEADYLNLLREDRMMREIGRGIAGSALIRMLLDAHPIVSDSDTTVATFAEYLLLAAVLRAGLPRPLTNAPLRLDRAVYYPDQFYAPERLVVEADGGVHRRTKRRGSDAARDAHMGHHGIKVLRVPNAEIERDADACAREVVTVWSERRAQLGLVA